MKVALIEARGDIFVASQRLNITALRLNRSINASPILQAALEISGSSAKRATDKQIADAIEERIQIYRVTGLDALNDLAAMPIDENSAQNQVKFAAAAKLAEGIGGVSSSGDMEGILRELRETYQKEAPRLRVIRERTTVEVVGQGEKTIDGEVLPASE